MKSTIILLVLLTLSQGARRKRQASKEHTKWPESTLNYYFSRKLPLEFQAMFRDAFEFISGGTCIRFHNDVERREEFSVRIRHDWKKKECYSLLGMQERGQELSFDYDCASFGAAVHELMHALGIFHEQARSDRDRYLIVDSGDTEDAREVDTYNPVPFDYGSVMLEGRVPRDPEYNYTMGSERIAFYDILLLNNYYNCDCHSHQEIVCQNGGYMNPANCRTCLCTDGFHGKHCEKLQGRVLEASLEWKEDGYALEDGIPSPRRTSLPEKYFLISAPPNATIEVQLTRLDGFFCHDRCDFNGIEIKFKEDRRLTSPFVCCNDDGLWNTTRRSTNNPLVIVMFGEERGPRVAWRYRYVAEGKEQRLIDNRID